MTASPEVLVSYLTYTHNRTTIMSMLLRRSLLRTVPRTRGFAAASGEGNYLEKQAALKAHAGGMWFMQLMFSLSC